MVPILQLLMSYIGIQCDTIGSTSSPDIPELFRHRAIAVLCVTTTSDGYLIVGKRSSHVDFGGHFHVVPAGRLQPNEGSNVVIIVKFNN